MAEHSCVSAPGLHAEVMALLSKPEFRNRNEHLAMLIGFMNPRKLSPADYETLKEIMAGRQ